MLHAVCVGNEAHLAVLDADRPTPQMVKAAAEVCKTCPVLFECFAAGQHEAAGVWGGWHRGRVTATPQPPPGWVTLKEVRVELGLGISQAHRWCKALAERWPHGLQGWHTAPNRVRELWLSPRLADAMRERAGVV
jgi:hypothetical protein